MLIVRNSGRAELVQRGKLKRKITPISAPEKQLFAFSLQSENISPDRRFSILEDVSKQKGIPKPTSRESHLESAS